MITKNRYMNNSVLKFVVVAFVSVFAVFGCTDTFEVHEEYIEGGEIVYTSKINNLVALSGNKRIRIVGTITNAFSVNEILVTWNNNQDSKTFPYTKSEAATDILELDIENLEEQSYEFQVSSKNSGGSSSVASTVFGNVLGDAFQSSLVARKVNSVSYNMTTQTGYANLQLPTNLTRSSEIKYTTLDGDELSVESSKDISEIALAQIDLTQNFEYRTFYALSPEDLLGNETSIDLFVSDWATFIPDLSIESVIESFSFEPIFEGVIARWENPNQQNLTFHFSFTNMDGEIVESDILSSDFVGDFTISNLANVEEEITVSVSNSDGNEWTNTFIVFPIFSTLIDKTNWSIAVVSSEEPAESTIDFPNNGLGEALIDGNVNTYWHTATDTTQPGFPHLVTIDLGEIKSVTSVELFRKTGDNGGAKFHQIFTSDVPDAGFELAGTYDGTLETDEGVFIEFNTIVATRYITYRTSQGDNHYTHLAEINVYAIE